MDRKNFLTVTSLVNIVGAIGSVACWVGDMGWRFLPAAIFFLLASLNCVRWDERTEDTSGGSNRADSFLALRGPFQALAAALKERVHRTGGLFQNLSDYIVSSFGWHLAVLSALGVGGWKLMVRVRSTHLARP